jgi:hypothetical protein
MSFARRFLTGFRETETSQPGLELNEDGTVDLVNPDGSRTTLPGSGGSSAVGFGVHLSAVGTIVDWDASTIPFDSVDWDTDSYWNATTHEVTIPSGKTGLYLVVIGGQMEYGGGPNTTHAGTELYFEASQGFNAQGFTCVLTSRDGDDSSTSAWAGFASVVVACTQGDIFYVDGHYPGALSPMQLSGADANLTVLQMTYLGPLA